MKKTLFKLFFTAFASILLFSSCLGDGGGNEITETGVFGYITTSKGGIQCAATDRGYYVTSERIRSLQSGRCYILGYTVTSDMTSEGIYNVQMKEEPVVFNTTSSSVSTPISNGINPTNLSVLRAMSNEYYGDNWAFYFVLNNFKDSDSSKAYFFYDESKQIEKVNGVDRAVGKNQMIIDVRFDYVAGADGTAKNNVTVRSVGNLKNIKTWYRGNHESDFDWKTSNGATYANVVIKFRYNQLQSNGTVKEDVYLGDWDAASYFFTYTK